MKSGFKDPVIIKKQSPKDKPEGYPKGNKDPWDFRCPQYDERSSCFVKAGTEYGLAHKQPVGHQGDPKMRVDVLPFGRPTTMPIDEI